MLCQGGNNDCDIHHSTGIHLSSILKQSAPRLDPRGFENELRDSGAQSIGR